MATKGLTAILFDFDGVIVDSEALHHRAYELALAPFGVAAIPRDVYADVFSNRGAGLEYCAGLAPGTDLRALKQRKNELFLELLARDARLLPGVCETIPRLAGALPLALATGSGRAAATMVLERFGLRSCFRSLIARENYAREKPAPDAFLEACAALAEAPEHCLAVEDSQKGLRAACAAGIPCLVVPNDYTRGGDFSGASATLPSLEVLSLERAEQIHRDACRRRDQPLPPRSS